MTPIRAAVQDVLGLTHDAKAETNRALDLIDDDIDGAVDSLNLVIEQADELATEARRALRLIEQERAK